jgi:hypothetical protein
MDETMGGGGGGSVLNTVASTCSTDPSDFFCNKYGALDLYRYASPGVPSFNTTAASAYFSINGGNTTIVQFNNIPGNGDMGDFAPACGPSTNNTDGNEYIQNAQNCTGQQEAYTTSSPEFVMEESIGWDATTSGTTPEPAPVILVGTALVALLFLRRRANETK